MKTNFKILMTLMGMEIGGAETHVLELCKNLKSRGVEVIVASNGGAYVKELTQFGIEHIEVPLHNKNPYNLFLSYKLLKKIIVENNITLVHAHARIPAYLCGLLQKKLHFRYVTTCHFVFRTDWPFKLMTNWGEQSLAVSIDLHDYLTNNYNIKAENIVVTINGIDNDKFSPDIKYDDILSEFKLNPEKKRILYLGRLDKDTTGATHALLDCCEEVYNLNKKIEIIIVGTGTDFANIRTKAEAINARIGKKLVYLTGPRTDANKLMACCDIFVGLSRAVLEAMSAAKPVVIAGTAGYLGIFDESKLKVAIDTNFCCRGCELVSSELIKNDLFKLLRMKSEELQSLGAYGREIIKSNYSVKRMADDALTLYSKVLKSNRPIDAVICGYYGSNNQGDDILLKAIINDLTTLKPDINIVVLSKTPKKTEKEYGVKSINRMDFIKISKLLKQSNLLISGGGTLIQDLTSTQSLLYYLYIISTAKKLGCKVMLYANGIGPVNRSKGNRLKAHKVLNKVDLITLRDLESKSVLKSLKVNKVPIAITADPAFGIKVENEQLAINKLEEIGLSNKKYFCISVRSWKSLKDNFESEIASLSDYIYLKHNLYPLFIPMQPEKDEKISRNIMKQIKCENFYLGNEYLSDEIIGIIKNAQFVVAMRLHAIIFAAKVGTPVIGLVYDPKVKAMMDRLDQKYYCNASEFNGETIRNYVDFAILNKDIISKGLLSESEIFSEKAFNNARLAISEIKKDCF